MQGSTTEQEESVMMTFEPIMNDHCTDPPTITNGNKELSTETNQPHQNDTSSKTQQESLPLPSMVSPTSCASLLSPSSSVHQSVNQHAEQKLIEKDDHLVIVPSTLNYGHQRKSTIAKRLILSMICLTFFPLCVLLWTKAFTSKFDPLDIFFLYFVKLGELSILYTFFLFSIYYPLFYGYHPPNIAYLLVLPLLPLLNLFFAGLFGSFGGLSSSVSILVNTLLLSWVYWMFRIWTPRTSISPTPPSIDDTSQHSAIIPQTMNPPPIHSTVHNGETQSSLSIQSNVMTTMTIPIEQEHFNEDSHSNISDSHHNICSKENSTIHSSLEEIPHISSSFVEIELETPHIQNNTSPPELYPNDEKRTEEEQHTSTQSMDTISVNSNHSDDIDENVLDEEDRKDLRTKTQRNILREERNMKMWTNIQINIALYIFLLQLCLNEYAESIVRYSFGEPFDAISFLPLIINRIVSSVLIRLTERQTKTYSFIDFLSRSVTVYGLKRFFPLLGWRQFVGFQVTSILLRAITMLKLLKPVSHLIYWIDTGVKRLINRALRHEIISISEFMNQNKFYERNFENCSKRFYSGVFMDLSSSAVLIIYVWVFQTLTLDIGIYYMIDMMISLGVSIIKMTIITILVDCVGNHH
ncbi:hypothetical protein C9374_009644 [Naegleria lovaniensis]|uniref:Transmembrane protein n=1 Tax=Naegleria lovaniensis TaxID=51637 RepID=A0AA88KRA6_NAELO|nr:uncharacterized protein C9374_009644 [Naegleria lovaniensis]KAG2393067.1 hypothetical protein C9374_009644 [Naegleria lovaniensis]